MNLHHQAKISDLFFQTAEIKNVLHRIKTAHQRNNSLINSLIFLSEKIEFLEKTVKSYDNHNLKWIQNEVNHFLLQDPSLHSVIIIIKNGNHIDNYDAGRAAYTSIITAKR